MKFSLILYVLFVMVTHTMAQFDYGYANTANIIQRNRVSSLSVYYFKNQTDSSLTQCSRFDSLGNRLSITLFSAEGMPYSKDTFLYDSHHLLIKQIKSEGSRIIYQSTFINNSRGKLMEQILEGDSLYLHSYCIYDDNDRLIQLKNYGINGDSLLIHTFYNKKGGVKKRLLYNNQDGRTVTITDFNAAGKATKTKKVYSQFADFATLEYSAGKSNYKHSTPVIEKPPKTAIKNMYSYYANGLSYEKVFFINQKPVSVEKTFYTYYQAGMANTPTAIQPASH